jgi:plastocyanin
MQKIVLLSGILLLCSLAIVFADETKSVKHSVTIKDMQFDPPELQIAPGDTVVWTNQDERDHTVSAKDGSFKSENLNRGDTFEHVFKKPGKFNYSCSYHPRMKGTIVVKGD